MRDAALGARHTGPVTPDYNPRPTLYRRGRLWTGVPSAPDAPPATAFLVVGSYLAWVGDESLADQHADESDVVDLAGAYVTPSFVDAHVHTTMTGQALDGVDLSVARSAYDALRLLENGARRGKGRPLYAHSWDESTWPENRPLRADEIDRATDGAFVYALRVDGHSAVVSSSVAAVARVDNHEGWDGEGTVTRDAHLAVRNVFYAGFNEDDRAHYIDVALRSAAEMGVGYVHEMGAPHLSSAEDLAATQVGTSSTGVRVVPYWGEEVRDVTSAEAMKRHMGVYGLAGDLNADGSIGSRTARLKRPYEDAPEGPGHRGFLYTDVEAIRDHVVACTRARIQAGYHVIGDEATHVIAQGFAEAEKLVGTEALVRSRHRLEHLEMLDDTSMQILARCGVWGSVQPAFDAHWGGASGMYAARLGCGRALSSNPLRGLLDAGINLALGTDSPITSFDPWFAIQACVNHHNPESRITAEEAMAAHTAGGHRIYRNDRDGVLAPGAAASFTIWDAGDLVNGLPDVTLGAERPTTLRTVVKGRNAFERDDWL